MEIADKWKVVPSEKYVIDMSDFPQQPQQLFASETLVQSHSRCR